MRVTLCQRRTGKYSRFQFVTTWCHLNVDHLTVNIDAWIQQITSSLSRQSWKLTKAELVKQRSPLSPFCPLPCCPQLACGWATADWGSSGAACTLALLPPPSCLPAGQGFPSSILPELKNYFHTFILGIHNHVSCCSFSQNAHRLSIWSCPIVLFLPIIVASFMTY